MEFSSFKQVGPISLFDGSIFFLLPFQSFPLPEYQDNKVLQGEVQFIESIITTTEKWFSKFPDCCPTHQNLKSFSDFSKEKYQYIPDQVLNNAKYFAFCIEQFIEEEDGVQNIIEYLDYLIDSFGYPDVGGHIFLNAARIITENIIIKGKEFSDEARLRILIKLEPNKPKVNEEKFDIETLYLTFQKWIEHLPNLGKFVELKKNFIGEVPMEYFITVRLYNRYSGRNSFKTRSRNELVLFLTSLTKEVLQISNQLFNYEKFDNSDLVLIAAERLKLRQSQLLKFETGDLEFSYSKLLENWMNNTIDFYRVVNQNIASNTQLLNEHSNLKQYQEKQNLAQLSPLAKTFEFALYCYFLGRLKIEDKIEFNSTAKAKELYKKYCTIKNNTLENNHYKVDSVSRNLSGYSSDLENDRYFTNETYRNKISNVRKHLIKDFPAYGSQIETLISPFIRR